MWVADAENAHTLSTGPLRLVFASVSSLSMCVHPLFRLPCCSLDRLEHVLFYAALPFVGHAGYVVDMRGTWKVDMLHMLRGRRVVRVM
jgi:hypothetical protein